MTTEKVSVVMENWNIPLTPRAKIGYSGENAVTELEIITTPEEGFIYYLETEDIEENANNILLTPDYVDNRIYVLLTTEMLGKGGILQAQVVAYIDTEEEPVKKSNIFQLQVNPSINATKDVESHYQTALSQWAQILASFNPQEVLAKLQEVEAEVNTAEEGITYITNLACRLYKYNSPTPATDPALYPDIREGDLTIASGTMYYAKTVTGSAITWESLNGGGGGTDDYEDLENKPSINNVTLSGNKTASDLGLVVPGDLAGYPTIYTYNGIPSTDPTDFPGIKDKDLCVDISSYPDLYRIYVANFSNNNLIWVPVANKTYASWSNPPVSASDQAGIRTGDIWIKFSGPSLSPNKTIYINTGISNYIYWWVNMSEGKLPTSSAADEGKVLRVDNEGFPEWNDLADKQDKLTAGEGISIDENNVISLGGKVEKSVVLYDGYSPNLTSTSNTSFPFVPYIDYSLLANVENLEITSITLNVVTTGTLSILVLKRDATGYPTSSATVKEVLTITETGVQTIEFSEPIIIGKTETIGFGNGNDTATFRYNDGRLLGFYFGSNSTWNYSVNNLGIRINAKYEEQGALLSSVYSEKKISILGDSISTFAGYIPSGNATYYPSGTVQSVEDTWWKKLITALNMTLEVNNSWSGSRVTTTNGTDSAGVTRASNLGTAPDVIIVWMGINDFNNEVALGTYDGKTAIPSDTTTFREAYAVMLNTILSTYKQAEVWVCTLPQCERNGTTGFPEVNGNGVALLEFNNAIIELAEAFGVKVLNHNKCGLTYQNMSVYNPDQLHPTKAGHSLVANNDIREMDNTVRTRY